MDVDIVRGTRNGSGPYAAAGGLEYGSVAFIGKHLIATENDVMGLSHTGGPTRIGVHRVVLHHDPRVLIHPNPGLAQVAPERIVIGMHILDNAPSGTGLDLNARIVVVMG